MWLFGKSSHSYIELVRILISLNLRHLNNMFEALRQTFTLYDARLFHLSLDKGT